MRVQPSNGIAVIASAYYPDSSAAACRLNVVCKLMQAAGLGPTVVSGQIAPRPDAPPADFPFYSMGEAPAKGQNPLIKAFRHLTWGGKSKDWFALHQDQFARVLIAGGYTPYSLRFLPFCRKRAIPMLVDAVEWFQPSHMPGGRFGPFALNIEIAMRWLYPRAGNIIAISRLLQRHFEAKGCHVIYLPAILDVLGVTPDVEPRPGDRPLRLAYTGTPGKKDLLNPMLEAILRLDPEGRQIHITLAGPTLRYLLDLPALKSRGISWLPNCISAPGYVSHDEATAIVREADFSVLLRPHQRYAMAGFPTKVPESLSVGTPVICNLTSDLGDFLVDGVQALICAAPSDQACLAALERALALPMAERAAMRRHARELAEKCFDFRVYTEPMKGFMQGLKLPRGSANPDE